MQLVIPSPEYKESFLEALAEYQKEKSKHNADLLALDYVSLKNNFQKYISLPKGYVPQTTYWLIDDNKFIGKVSIRHLLTKKLLQEGGHIGYDIRPSERRKGYGKKILTLALPRAKELGITRVLVTCDETNIGSRKIIEANSGALENIVEVGNGKPCKLRYWIML